MRTVRMQLYYLMIMEQQQQDVCLEVSWCTKSLWCVEVFVWNVLLHIVIYEHHFPDFKVFSQSIRLNESSKTWFRSTLHSFVENSLDWNTQASLKSSPTSIRCLVGGNLSLKSHLYWSKHWYCQRLVPVMRWFGKPSLYVICASCSSTNCKNFALKLQRLTCTGSSTILESCALFKKYLACRSSFSSMWNRPWRFELNMFSAIHVLDWLQLQSTVSLKR